MNNVRGDHWHGTVKQSALNRHNAAHNGKQLNYIIKGTSSVGVSNSTPSKKPKTNLNVECSGERVIKIKC